MGRRVLGVQYRMHLPPFNPPPLFDRSPEEHRLAAIFEFVNTAKRYYSRQSITIILDTLQAVNLVRDKDRDPIPPNVRKVVNAAIELFKARNDLYVYLEDTIHIEKMRPPTMRIPAASKLVEGIVLHSIETIVKNSNGCTTDLELLSLVANETTRPNIHAAALAARMAL